MNKKPDLLTRVSSGIMLASLLCLFLYAAVVKNGSHTHVGYVLAVIVAGAVSVLSGVMFVNFLSKRQSSTGTDEMAHGGRIVWRPLRLVVLGIATFVLSLALVVGVSFFGSGIRWQSLVVSAVAPVIALLGLFFIVLAIFRILTRNSR